MKHSTQNYLKTIFSLSGTTPNSIVKVSDISKKLDVSPAAVTDMVKKLEQEGYVKSEPYKGLVLTESGWKVGCNMVRHHRLWEAFLHLELGLSWDEVHEEAEQLEHACSDKLINKIEEKMNFPKYDPHGHPIPDRYGNFPTL
jgi:DtxR family Mn-dependent transcriptional regulator